MAVDPKFAKWAKGFSGCDGGNLKGSIWLCGIEWGLGKPHALEKELQEDESQPPQRYTKADDVLRGPDGPYPFNTMFLKLIAAMKGRPLEEYKNIANEEPFPFHCKSDYFKLNLFPVAFKKVDAALWEQYRAATGLTSRREYERWCIENRFPMIRSWVKVGQPKLIVCVGLSYIEDFHGAFGIRSKKHEETIQGKRLVWFADDTTTVAVVPSPTSPSGLNSNRAILTFGQRLSGIVGMKQERGSSPSQELPGSVLGRAGPLPAASAAPVPTPVKVGVLPAETRLTWYGGGHVQKGNSRGYNEWMARTGTFTVQAAMDAGIPKHHLRYVTGQGWARRA